MSGMRLYVLLVAAVLLCGLAAMLPMVWLGGEVIDSSYREYALRDMTANANLVKLAIQMLPAEGRDAKTLAFLRDAKDPSQTRFTFVAPGGRVLYDSDENAVRMENHGNRPEVAEALAGRTGTDIRKSPTLGDEWIYAAIPLENGGALRAAASLDEVNLRLEQWWRKALTGVALSLVLLVFLALAAARLLSRPLETVTEGAERFSRGDFSRRIPAVGSAETHRLIAALNDMARELDTRFRLITRQGEEMRAMFASMSEGVLGVDADGKIAFMNAAAGRMLGIGEDAYGKTVETALRNPGLLDLLRETAGASGTIEREILLPAGAAADAVVQARATRMGEPFGNGVTGTLAVLRDVTALRRLEAVRRDFVANVSHELRTPVTSIQSCLETLTEGGLEDREAAEEFLAMALRNARRLNSIISNLLLLAGMESGDGKETGKAASEPVSPVLEEAVAQCREAAATRHVAFEIDCPPDLRASMNSRLLVHAVVNLLDNAVKYGPEDAVVTIRAARDGDKTRITVADRGPGIPPRYQSRVFERFYRVDGAPRLREGVGLGLSIVKHIVNAYGGDIRLESGPGAGSAFTLILPAEAAQPGAKA